ncbi:MAG: Ni/Fe-hydrogenase, b-type cytochrome subunit [Hyphomicrobiaceae bacterium]|nr:Ni/Fe-hydrogenase, b-type cytochrome subunit [Hyphomicrobiaceae bacterium]
MLALYLFGPVKAEDHYKGTVYVYEVPVRIWHWVNAIAILVLCVTGWFIGNPPPSMQLGEATQQFAFGYIRFTHFAAAMIMTIGFGGRVYWAFKGNHHARQLFILPLLDKNWWSEVLFEIRWYLFLEKEPKKYVGHNPLAQASMFTFVTLGMIFMISTGFALYAEALGSDHWLSVLFSPVKYFVNNSQLLRTIHSLGMWIIIIFSMIHIYLAIREDIMSRQTIVSSMISGYRTFKDDRP